MSNSNPVKSPILFKGKHFLKSHSPDIMNEGGDTFTDEDFIYPLSLRDLIASFIRNLNALESKKFARALLY